jgi:hypothetical protein
MKTHPKQKKTLATHKPLTPNHDIIAYPKWVAQVSKKSAKEVVIDANSRFEKCFQNHLLDHHVKVINSEFTFM